MKKKSIFKKGLTAMLSMVMALGAVGTSWAGNVADDNGNCFLKIMTTEGALSSLPSTNFKGKSVYLIPAGAKMWIASDGSTADPNTVSLEISVGDKDHTYDGSGKFESLVFEIETYSAVAKSTGAASEYVPFFNFDEQYPLFEEMGYDNSYIYCLHIYDEEDGSWLKTYYLLDDGSYPIIGSGWKQTNMRWWYQNADGSYPKSTWQLIDGKYYYFDESGYMLSSTTTPDGYQVGADGARIQSE